MAVLSIRLPQLGLPAVENATVVLWDRTNDTKGTIVPSTATYVFTNVAGTATATLVPAELGQVNEVRIVIRGDVVFSATFFMPGADAFLDELPMNVEGDPYAGDDKFVAGLSTMQNDGGGAELFTGVVLSVAHLRTLLAGSGISIATAGDGIIITNTRADGAKGDQGIQGAAGTNGTNGTNGQSAYALAVAGGFVGNEAAWIDSLRGAQGIQGATGNTGAAGQSAYALAVALGFVGNQAQWIASLKGVKGDVGNDGPRGYSAYELAVQNGYAGSEASWIASLKGDAGVNGVNGIDGRSAYEIAVADGFLGSEPEWLATLVGISGVTAWDMTNLTVTCNKPLNMDGATAISNGFTGIPTVSELFTKAAYIVQSGLGAPESYAALSAIKLASPVLTGTRVVEWAITSDALSGGAATTAVKLSIGLVKASALASAVGFIELNYKEDGSVTAVLTTDLGSSSAVTLASAPSHISLAFNAGTIAVRVDNVAQAFSVSTYTPTADATLITQFVEPASVTGFAFGKAFSAKQLTAASDFTDTHAAGAADLCGHIIGDAVLPAGPNSVLIVSKAGTYKGESYTAGKLLVVNPNGVNVQALVQSGVQSYPSIASFPASGDTDALYIAADTGLLYRWDGTAYVAAFGGGFSMYDTKAAANAAVAGLPELTIVEVLADESQSGARTRYRKESGSLVFKIAVEQFTQAGTGAVQRSVQAKLRDVVSVKDFGAVGDGVADDTAAFKLIEAIAANSVNLAGKTYAIESAWADAVNGVVLSKDYINGTLLVDGRKLFFDRGQGFARSAAGGPRRIQPSTSKQLGIQRVSANDYRVWRPLGGQFWQRCTVSRDASGVPLNWRETRIKQVLGYICAQDTGVTYSGGWATLNATSGLNSAATTTYVSGRARQAIAASDYVEITYTGGGDLYVVFVGRTTGNYVNVLLDGKQDYLTLPDDGAGNRYFDSYTATDLKYRQVVKIASAVPAGAHTIRLTVSATKNGASAGNRFVFNALAFDSTEIGPWRAEADAPAWATGQSVLQYQVRKYAGRYYYASADGTTGATPPTHTSGSVSDGGVTWVYRAASGYDLVDSRIQASGSQLEYAYEIKPAGAAAKEDVGGNLHGNESQTAMAILVGGAPVTMIDAMWVVGDSVAINESITVTHSEIGAGSAPVVLSELTRTFLRQHVEVSHKHTLQMAAEIGYMYPHMWPLLHYDGAGMKYAVRKVWTPCDGDRACADFYSQSNPFVGRTKDLLMIAYGDCLQPDGAGGVPTVEAAPLKFAAWLSVDPSSVDNYDDANRLFAAKAMNTSGADVSAGGYSSMTSKMYFERYSSQSPKSLPSGYVIECHAQYGLALTAS